MSAAAGLLPLAEARKVIAEAVQPAHFFVGQNIRLEWQHVGREEIPWEIFQGRLLDGAQTRQQRSFEAWNIFLHTAEGRSTEPLLAVKLDVEGECLHVIRSIYSYAWEGYHAGDNVYLSREVRKWVRELVATVPLRIDGAMQSALAERLFQAVVGLSRLPLNSIEAPLTSFSFGQVAYFFQPGREASEPMRSPTDLIGRALTTERRWPEKAKLLEFLLRSTPADRLAEAVRLFASRWEAIRQDSLPALFRMLFQEVSLSPYTDFVEKFLAFLGLLQEQGHLSEAEHVDFLSSLLRQLGRHLTAYDLVVFHHRGANYPDALLLDEVLRAFLELAERQPTLWAPFANDEECVARIKRLRRRALRQAVLLRCQYEGHEVPDAPNSLGENLRVLPEPAVRVPDEQIIDPSKRSRRLFAEDALLPRLSAAVRHLLQASIDDLDEQAELRELGTALFLDRPLGIGKRPTEPDQSLLLSYVAYSATVAERRLQFLVERLNLLSNSRYPAFRDRVRRADLEGIPLGNRPGPARPGVVSLSDALKVAPDFILLRSTRRSIDEFLAYNALPLLGDRADLDFLTSDRPALIVGSASVAGQRPGLLLVYDGDLRLRLQLAIDPNGGLRPAGAESRAHD